LPLRPPARGRENAPSNRRPREQPAGGRGRCCWVRGGARRGAGRQGSTAPNKGGPSTPKKGKKLEESPEGENGLFPIVLAEKAEGWSRDFHGALRERSVEGAAKRGLFGKQRGKEKNSYGQVKKARRATQAAPGEDGPPRKPRRKAVAEKRQKTRAATKASRRDCVVPKTKGRTNFKEGREREFLEEKS